MTNNIINIQNALKNKGFTGKFTIEFLHIDGWRCTCDQMQYHFLGGEITEALMNIKFGEYDFLVQK